MRKLAVAGLVLLAAGTLVPVGAESLAGAVAKPVADCGTAAAPPATYDHVVWIVMENHSYEDVVGASVLPYYNGTLIAHCGLATGHSITHPSLPNYIGMTSGLSHAELGAHFSATCSPGDPGCTTDATSIFHQTASWKAYQENMPSNCFKTNSGKYAVRHNPPAYYTTLADCATKDVPYTQLAADVKANTLPAFSFITPDLCNDTHDCLIQSGDKWLKREVPKLLKSKAYKAGRTAIFITYDEGFNNTTGVTFPDCEAFPGDRSCHIATVVIAPSVPKGVKPATDFTHYSLLRTAEEMLGLPTLGLAGSATSMRASFNV